jgi:hypothetical protein
MDEEQLGAPQEELQSLSGGASLGLNNEYPMHSEYAILT